MSPPRLPASLLILRDRPRTHLRRKRELPRVTDRSMTAQRLRWRHPLRTLSPYWGNLLNPHGQCTQVLCLRLYLRDSLCRIPRPCSHLDRNLGFRAMRRMFLLAQLLAWHTKQSFQAVLGSSRKAPSFLSARLLLSLRSPWVGQRQTLWWCVMPRVLSCNEVRHCNCHRLCFTTLQHVIKLTWVHCNRPMGQDVATGVRRTR